MIVPIPVIEFNELSDLFGYANIRAARRAIRLKTFPVQVFEMAGRTVAHKDAVTHYFAARSDESLMWTKHRYGMQKELDL